MTKLVRCLRFHVVFHMVLVLGLELGQLGFLIGGQDLYHFGHDAGVLDLHFDHGLGMLRGEGASLGFVEGTGGLKCAHISFVLVHLLHQRFECRFFFVPDSLDLGLLIAGQVEIAATITAALMVRMRIRVDFIG